MKFIPKFLSVFFILLYHVCHAQTDITMQPIPIILNRNWNFGIEQKITKNFNLGMDFCARRNVFYYEYHMVTNTYPAKGQYITLYPKFSKVLVQKNKSDFGVFIGPTIRYRNTNIYNIKEKNYEYEIAIDSNGNYFTPPPTFVSRNIKGFEYGMLAGYFFHIYRITYESSMGFGILNGDTFFPYLRLSLGYQIVWKKKKI